ncbi:MAG: glycoside hydrolase family 2 TIM barrel-domain containing protein, partial [Verrucomicrobiota bacterium]
TVVVPKPTLWGVAEGNLYELVTSIEVEGKEVDEARDRFGIRSIRYDAKEGFFLNGENTAIKGVCLHHDGGLVGAAVPKDVWRRRFEELREGGCNAIRVAHQPGARDFMELCDEMGFLVQTEFFDEWDLPKDKRLNRWEQEPDYITRGYAEHFQERAESDLKITALRDRNHPSVIMWCIGNEIEWTYPRYKAATGYFGAEANGNYFWTLPPFSADEIKARYEASEEGPYVLAETAAKLARWTKEMDDTRPTVANMILPSIGHVSGYADALDIIGYSYRRVMYDRGHRDHPEKMIMGTENLPQWHEWKAIEERPFIPGTFLWTGIDYMGEVHKRGWPLKALSSGLLDVGGFRKPAWQMYRTLWREEPHVYLCSQTVEKSPFKIEGEAVVEKKPGAWEKRLWFWHEVNEHWNYETAGEMVIVEGYTNCEEVELFLDGVSLGVKRLGDFEDRMLKWAVPYAVGELKAVGTKDGEKVEFVVRTHAEPTAVVLEVDRESLAANEYDCVHVFAQLVDGEGNPVLSDEREVSFEVVGPCNVLGVDNGAATSIQDYQAMKVTTSKGRAMMILQALDEAGEIVIRGVGDGLEGEEVKVEVTEP